MAVWLLDALFGPKDDIEVSGEGGLVTMAWSDMGCVQSVSVTSKKVEQATCSATHPWFLDHQWAFDSAATRVNAVAAATEVRAREVQVGQGSSLRQSLRAW